MKDNQIEEQKEENKQFLGTMDECGERVDYHNLVDILFVIDTTGSMSWCISQMKKTVCKIMKKFADKQYNIKFAIQVYRDHPPQQFSYIEKHFDLRNQDAIIQVIDNECEVGGGGDTPEAVFDGLINGLKKTSWRISTDGKTKSKRFLFHGCDAPPHGKQYGSFSSDPKWTQNGCPSGYTRHDVKKLLDQNNVDYSLIKCGTQVEVMAALFKQCFGSRFKRQIEIKKESYKSGKKYGGGRKLERKLSVQYMEEIQRQYLSGCEYQEQQECHGSIEKELCVDQFDAPIRKMCFKQEKEDIKKKDKKKKKKMSIKKKEEYSNSSSDEQKGGRPRSMASLVLSDVEDGIESYFEQPVKSKQTKDI